MVGIADDAAETDRKLDKFIAEQRTNPLYADSLLPPVRPSLERKPKFDPLNLTREQFDAVAAGKIVP